MTIHSATVEELQAEIARRTKKLPKPSMLEQPDFSTVQKLCQWYIDIAGTDRDRDGNEVYIFEAALEACFGEDVWKYVSQQNP